MGDLSQNFFHSERRCKCDDCNRTVEPYFIHHVELIERLEEARLIFKAPIVINSWCRCQKHNAVVGGVDSSAHVMGWAVDIKCYGSKNRYRLRDALMQVGFNRFGTGKGYLHVDMDPSKPIEVEWVY